MNLPTPHIYQKRPANRTGAKLDKGRRRPDPGNLVGRLAPQLMDHVVLLEDAKRVCEAEGGKGDEGGSGGDGPRLGAAVGGSSEGLF